jgi:micrococcal nuclease
VTSGRTLRGGCAVLVALGVTTAAWAQQPKMPKAGAGTALAPDAKGKQRSGRDFSQLPKYQVVRVVDGGSMAVMIDGQAQTVRLIGVENTPAVPGAGKDARDRVGKQAAQYMTEQLQNKAVYLEPEKPGQTQTDTAGRVLAYVYRAPDGLFVNQELIAQGHARATAKNDFRLFDAFQAEEQKAKAGKLGVWAGAATESATAATAKTKDDDSSSETFYYVRGSKKYHREGCRVAGRGASALTLADVKAKKLEPCAVCKPDQPAQAKATTTTAAPKGRTKKRFQSQADQRRMLDNEFLNLDPTAGGGGGGVVPGGAGGVLPPY